MGEIHTRIISNLQRFNAKERDHLMRFAYLGSTQPYGGHGQWLSESCLDVLKEVASAYFDPRAEPERVFAAMDYHLDWLHAALTLARAQPDWDGASKSGPHDRQPSIHSGQELTGCSAVEGTQEDLDLLVVFRDARGLLVLCVEAKASPRFGLLQLGRKLIRLDTILAAAADDDVRGLMVLAAPAPPQVGIDPASGAERSCPEFAARARQVAAEASGWGDARVDERHGLGCQWVYLPLSNLPAETSAVTRVDNNHRPGAKGSLWMAVPRWRRHHDN